MVRLKSVLIIVAASAVLAPLSTAQTTQYPLAKTYATVEEAIAAASVHQAGQYTTQRHVNQQPVSHMDQQSTHQYKYGVPVANIEVFGASQPSLQNASTYTYESPTSTYTSSYAPNEGPANTQYSYTVQSGDTLYDIAKRHGIKVSDVMNANQLSTSSINPGQALLIPVPTSSGFTTSSNVEAVESNPVIFASQVDRVVEPLPTLGQNYRVLPGDTLSSIARLNCSSIDAIINSSGITRDGILSPGQYLTVPQGTCAQ